MEPLRNYHYLSRTKVEMFWDQLPGSRWTGGGEFGVSAGIVASVKAQRNQGEPTLAQKMLRVEDYINRTEHPGSLLSPQPFIRDRVQLAMVVLETEGKHETLEPTLTGSVLFAGRTRYGTSVVLGGSAAHLVSAQSAAANGINSNFYYIQHQLTHASQEWRHVRSAVDLGEDEPLYEHGHVARPPTGSGDAFLRDCVLHMAELGVQGDYRFRTVGYCEFLARTIRVMESDDDYGPTEAILATPLYVAQLDIDEPPPPPHDWGDRDDWP